MNDYPDTLNAEDLNMVLELRGHPHHVKYNNMGARIVIINAGEARTVVYAQEFGVGSFNKVEMKVSADRIANYFDSGDLIQVALHDLTPDEREFLLTGITPGGYDAMMAAVE